MCYLFPLDQHLIEWSVCTFALLPPPSFPLGYLCSIQSATFFLYPSTLSPSLCNQSDGHSDTLYSHPPLLEMLSLHPSNLRLSNSLCLSTFLFPRVFLFSRTYTSLFLSNLPSAPIPSTSLPREPSFCCCAVFWYMCIFGRSVLSGEPDWPGWSKQREETWQRKLTHTHKHKSRNTSCNGRILTAPYCRQAHTYPPPPPPCMSELGLRWPQHTTGRQFTKFFPFWWNLVLPIPSCAGCFAPSVNA